MNPLIPANRDWVNQVNTIAKQKGMITVIVMNTEDRILDNSNWGTYSSKVIESCSMFSGKANELVVGNEISLHSYFTKTDIKMRVENLINSCKGVFSGTVSYEAFWYEKDAWIGYPGKLYFNMYENVDSYATNIREMRTKFPSASVGEWGEDLFDGSTYRDENWQKQEVQKRWDVLQTNNVPVAYVFTYKEPDYSGFGLVRYDDSKRPAWYIFASSVTPPAPISTTNTITTLPQGICSTYTFGSTQVKVCDKGNNRYEMYLVYGTTTICYKTYCVGQNSGFVSFTTTQTVTPPPTPTTTQSSSVILVDGTCSTQTISGTTVKVCDKGSGWYEMYLVSGTNTVCYQDHCVGTNTGFQRFTK